MKLLSQVPGFQILARAIETGDLSEWRRQDPTAFNTDWAIYEAREKAWNEWLEKVNAPKNEETSN